jgi:metal transporter CNNM
MILSADTILDHKAVDAMCVLLPFTLPNCWLTMFHSLLSGYSRFPVHEAGNPLAFIGLLLIKKVGPCDDTDSLF